MTDASDLKERLLNPLWVHSDEFESPQLEKDATLSDLKEAADRIAELETWQRADLESRAIQNATIEALEAQLADARKALEDIINPLGALKRYAAEQGRQLQGIAAMQLAQDPGHLRSIARTALTKLRGADDDR